MISQVSENHAKSIHELLIEAIKADGADMGNIQIYLPSSKTLMIVAQDGFKDDFLTFFKRVKAFDSSACGRAIAIGNPVMINDVHLDQGFASLTKIAEAANFKAVKSVPIIHNDKEFLGVISTHFEKPQSSWDVGKISNTVDKLKPLLQEILREHGVSASN
ncbi:MAG: GAF domain-containing protein [Bacteroidota bacterium]